MLTTILAVMLLAVSGSHLVAVLLAVHFCRERNAWRRTAYRTSMHKRNAETDTTMAHAVARDLAERGFRGP